MSKASPVHTDPRVLRPIIEALIFASEEPLPPRLLVRLLAGERDEPRSKASTATGANGHDTPTSVEETTFSEEALSENADDSYTGSDSNENDSALNDSNENDSVDMNIDIDAESGSGNPDDLANAFSDLLSDEPVQSIDQRL